MMAQEPCRVRLATAGDREQVWNWRNDPSVRSFMFSTSEVPWADHVAWFERTLVDPTKHALIFEINGEPSGFANIQELPSRKVAEWGFYKAPGAPGGTGKTLGGITLRYAFEILQLHKIYAQVLAFNQRSIELHLALGFEQEGLLRDQHFDGRAYYDVYCFGLRDAQWTETFPYAGPPL